VSWRKGTYVASESRRGSGLKWKEEGGGGKREEKRVRAETKNVTSLQTGGQIRESQRKEGSGKLIMETSRRRTRPHGYSKKTSKDQGPGRHKDSGVLPPPSLRFPRLGRTKSRKTG